MWAYLSRFILQYKKIILVFFIVSTLFATYEATKVKLAFNPGKVLPTSDADYIKYSDFKKQFGEDGKVMVIGIQSEKLFQKDFFNGWFKLSKSIQSIKGISNVVSIANLPLLGKDTTLKKFVFQPILDENIQNQVDLDSIKSLLQNLPFYQNIIINSEKNATIMAITLDEETLNTANKIAVIQNIENQANQFGIEQQTEVHFSGLPYIKTVVSSLVAKEFILFLGLSVVIAGLILGLFFRSFYSVLFPLLFVLSGVIWSIGLMALLNYYITLLTGVIPPLIVIIGIPNCILILNKYRTEYQKKADRQLALRITIERISLTTFIANLTTAIGFGVLCFTNSDVLKEFGITAAIGVMFTWLICLCLLPILLSFIHPPKISQNQKSIKNPISILLQKIDSLVHFKRKWIYITVIILIGFAALGISQININGFVVDDLPTDDPVYQDLKFFEASFDGILPLEISVNAKRKNSIMSLSNIKKIDRLEKLVSSYPEVGKAISINSVLKYSSQAFYNGSPKFYRIPNEMEKNFILIYAANAGKKNNLLKSFLDDDRQVTRVTFNMKDIGSKKMNAFLGELKPRIDSIFNPEKYDVTVTGPILMYVKGTDYLVNNLRDSLLLAIFLIAIVMWILFRGLKMVLVSLLPNLIPLLITAGVMGFCGLALKPSTILIFSIALGIASDQTIYFLTRFQQEKKLGNLSIAKIVSETIHETGLSMIYTAIILFFGFGIFAFSTFGGTVALGTLLSLTLLVSMIFNLTFLPAILLSLDQKK